MTGVPEGTEKKIDITIKQFKKKSLKWRTWVSRLKWSAKCPAKWLKIYPHQGVSSWNFRTMKTKRRSSMFLERKNSPIQEVRNRMAVEFSVAAVDAKRQWCNDFKILKKNYIQIRVLYPARPSL